MPTLNSLGDLTDRHNRAFNPRHVDDYFNGARAPLPDGLPDDFNTDDIPDFYPTLYPGAFTNPNPYGQVLLAPDPVTGNLPPVAAARTFDQMGFPYVYPNGYSQPDPNTLASYGAIHSLDPSINPTTATTAYYPRVYNHGPLDLGDPLGVPGTGADLVGLPDQEGDVVSLLDRPDQAAE